MSRSNVLTMVTRISRYVAILSALCLVGYCLHRIYVMRGKGSTYNGVFEQTLSGHSNLKRIAHIVVDKQDIGANRLYEYVDDEDVTRFFRREIFTRVCTDTSCMPIRLRLYWDVIGDFLGFELPEGVELEKDEDNVFTKKDYEKLTEVLGDPVSILDTYGIDELVPETEGDDTDSPDGMTGATAVAIKNAVVENAVYTTYTLWHVVYGQTRSKIRELAAQRQNTSFLLYMLNSAKASHQLWAIDQIKARRLLQDEHFYPVIIKILNAKDETAANWALGLFEKGDVTDSKIQHDLYSVFDRSSFSMKFSILKKLSQAETVNQEIIMKLLEDFVENDLGPGVFTYIMDLTANIKEPNELLLSKLISLLSHPNFYVSRKIYMYLVTLEKDTTSLQNEILKFRAAQQDRL